jgi:hypothetical protein
VGPEYDYNLRTWTTEASATRLLEPGIRRTARGPSLALRSRSPLLDPQHTLAPQIAVGASPAPFAIPAWGARCASIFAATAALVCLYAIRQVDPDLYGYLAYGRLFVERGLTAHDPFAYTSAGFNWITFEYLAHIALWSAYHYAGAAGLIALKCLVGGVALVCLFVAMRQTPAETFVWVPIFLLCTSTLSRYFLFRPQLFTFAFFACFTAVLFRYLLRHRGPLWVLPIVMVAWANTHGGFVSGLGAVGLAISLRALENTAVAGWRPRHLLAGTGPLWATLAACTGATVVNPLGVRLWFYVLTELAHGTNRRYIAEWAPASFATDAWSTVMLTLIGAMLVLVTWLCHRLGRATDRPAWPWAASAVPLIALSYLSVRHVPLAAIWAGPVIALLGSRVQNDISTFALGRRLWFVVRGFAVAPAVLTVAIVLARPAPTIQAGGAVLGSTHPCGAVEYLRANAVTGNVYTPLWWGAYVTWHLYPAIRVSMDGRNISLYSDEMVLENLKFYTDAARDVNVAAPLRYDTDFLLIPSDSAALSPLSTDGRWQTVYSDRDSTLLLRADARHAETAIRLSARPASASVAGCKTVLN